MSESKPTVWQRLQVWLDSGKHPRSVVSLAGDEDGGKYYCSLWAYEWPMQSHGEGESLEAAVADALDKKPHDGHWEGNTWHDHEDGGTVTIVTGKKP